MSQTNPNNVKRQPMRMSELMATIKAIQDSTEEDTEDSTNLLNRSFSDDDFVNKNSHACVTNEVTYPNDKTNKDLFKYESNAYNQTYPNKDSQSCSASKTKNKTVATPMKTPKYKLSSAAKASYRIVTPRLSSKKKTPVRSRSKGTSTLKKNVCIEGALKSVSAKYSLFPAMTHSKKQPLNRDLFKNELKCELEKPNDQLFFATPLTKNINTVYPRNSDSIIGDELDSFNQSGKSNIANSNKGNSYFSRQTDKLATPQSVHNISSNLIVRGCRENDITPHKFLEMKNNFFETPSTQYNAIPTKHVRTPLFPINDHFKHNLPNNKSTVATLATEDKENINAKTQERHEKKCNDNQNMNDQKQEEHEIILSPVRNEKLPLVNENKITPLQNRPFSNQASSHHPPINKHDGNLQVKEKPFHNEPANLKQYTKPIGSTYFATNNQIANHGTQPLVKSVPQESVKVKQSEEKVTCEVKKKQNIENLEGNLKISQPQILQKQFKSITIKGKPYIFLRKLGSGGSSEVFQVMDPADSSMYAVKCVNLAVDTSVAQGYIDEIKLLLRLQGSDRVIKLYDHEYLEKQRKLYVLLELGNGDLSRLLKSYKPQQNKLPLAMLVYYWTEMLMAVQHIHENDVIHSDLKPANFLFVKGRLKLIDFGIALSISGDATSIIRDSTTGTLNYISPEAIANEPGGHTPKISYKSDVWSLGCILYSMLYGKTPLSHTTNMWAKMATLTNPNHVIDYPPLDGIPTVLMDAVRWCLTFDIKKRPSVQELLNLEYISRGHLHKPKSPKDIPPSILVTIKKALTPEEWKTLTEYLDS